MKLLVHGKDINGAAFETELEVSHGQVLGFDANGLPVATNYLASVSLGQETTAYAASMELNCTGKAWRLITLAGNIALTGLTNKGEGKELSVRIKCDGTPRNLVFNVLWVFVGVKPTTIAANKTAVLTLRCFGGSEADVLAQYSVEA